MGLSFAQLAALLLLPASAVLAFDGPTQKLKPMTPPSLDTHDRLLLKPSNGLTLYFTTPEEDLQTRDTPEVFAQVDFQFKMPAVAVDHTDYIEVLGCSEDSLKAKFNDAKAFSQASAAWKDKKVLLVTSFPGCGTPDTSNGFLEASSVEFFEDEFTIKASGVFANPSDTFENVRVEWGATDVPASGNGDEASIKKRAEKSTSLDFEMSPQVAAGLLKGKDYPEALRDARTEDAPNAPWPLSFLLWSTKKSSKRDVELAERANGELDAALNLYCVDCGVRGRITLGGRFDFNIFQGITQLEAFFNGQLHAGLYLGFEAYLNYQKEWKQSFINANLAGWEIAGIASVGPYMSLDLEATFAVHAKGLLIVGGALDWPDFGANLNILDPEQSNAWGFTPQLSKSLNVSAELDISASLGLPVSIGLQIAVGDAKKPWWKANARFQDTPSLNAKATAKLEYNAKRSIDGIEEFSEFDLDLLDDGTIDATGESDSADFDDSSLDTFSEADSEGFVDDSSLDTISDADSEGFVDDSSLDTFSDADSEDFDSTSLDMFSDADSEDFDDTSLDTLSDTSATEADSLFEKRADTCYGINWEITVRNTMKVVAEADGIGSKEHTIRDDSWTLGKGCIAAPQPKCKGNVLAAPVVPSSVKCNQRASAYNEKYNSGSLITGKDRKGCAKSCITRDSCKAFAFKQASQSCWILTAPFASIGATASTSSDAWEIFDKNCYESKDCILATDTKPSTVQ